MLALTIVASALCVLDLAAVIVVCSRPPVRRPAPTPLPRPEPLLDLYPAARHRNTNDESTIRLPKAILIGGSPR